MTDLRRKPRGLPPNAMQEQTEASCEKLFYPMGESLLFRTNDQMLLDAAEETFGGFPPHPQRSPQAPLKLQIFLHDVDSHGSPRFGGTSSRPIYRTHGHLMYVSLGAANTAAVDLLKGCAFGFVTADMAHDRPTLRHIFLEGLALIMLGTARQFIPVHAACVVGGGMSISLLGSAGSGKSTLAYACVRRGYQLLAEDGLMVKCQPEGATLWGIPWKLHLLPDAKSFFPELAAEEPKLQVNGEWKLEVRPERYFPGSTRTHAAPGPVLFLEQGSKPGPTRMQPLAGDEALESFEVVWPWWVGWTDEMERQLPRLLSHGAYRLRVQGPPDEIEDALDALVAEHNPSGQSPQ